MAFRIIALHWGWGFRVKGGKSLNSKSKKVSLLIIICILLTGLSAFAYFNLFETTSEPKQALVQKDVDTNIETPASLTKSTIFLIVCIGIVGILSIRRKKAVQANLYIKEKEVSK